MRRLIALLLVACLLLPPAPPAATAEGLTYAATQAAYRRLMNAAERYGPDDLRTKAYLEIYLALQKRYMAKHDGTPVPTVPPPAVVTPPPAGGGATGGGTTARILDPSWLRAYDRERVISDADFTNAACMSVADIQSFLERKGSVLARPVDGVRPAQAIYLAARANGVSPLVLLATLQKEHSLVSAKTATRKQLDWAFGVGCYDSGNWNTKYRGFEKQVYSAAKTLRNHYDAGAKKLAAAGSITMTIDGREIRCRNAATYSLYKYTPHLAGNELFWKVAKGYYQR